MVLDKPPKPTVRPLSAQESWRGRENEAMVTNPQAPGGTGVSECNLAQSAAPQGAEQQRQGFQKGPKASRSLPDTGASPPAGPEWRQLSSTRGGAALPHPQEPVLLRQLSQETGAGPAPLHS